MGIKDCEKLFEDNYKLIFFVLNNYFDKQFDEDLAQIGAIGLWNACRNFNQDHSKFSTFATKCIYNEILKEVQKHSFPKRKGNATDVSLYENIEEHNDIRYIDTIKSKNDFIICDLNLTKEEKKILRYIMDGKKQDEIRSLFNCSIGEINLKIKKIKEKLKNSVLEI